MKAEPPENERERLEALRRYEILDTEFESSFDRLTDLACYICKTPIAAISLVDEDRQWFKAISGLDARQTHRDVAFCAHAILRPDVFIVADARRDERFQDNALVTSAPDIRYYAGVPLVTSDGFALGTLCVIDRVPRELEGGQLEALRTLADQTMAQLELRLSVKRTREYIDALELAEMVYTNSSDGMMVTDENNKVIAINPAFTRLTGYTQDEVFGRTPSFLNSGRQDKSFYQRMWESIRVSDGWQGEIWNRRKNGDIYAELLTINVIRSADGDIHRHVALFSDITEKKISEERDFKQRAELLRSNAELEQFAYVASHDLRQPLRMINSYTRLLDNRMAGTVDEETREFMTFIRDGGTRMDQMLVSLLEYSRVGHGDEPAEDVDSRELLDEALRFLGPEVTDAHADLRVSGDWPKIAVGRDEGVRLFQNLIGNALKYVASDRAPVVSVSVEATGEGWLFSVADNGIGIDPSQFGRLFKVFQRLHARDEFEGEGIGLAVCRKIVERMGGRIWVESGGKDRGSVFRFTVPATAERHPDTR